MCVLCGQLVSDIHWTERTFAETEIGGAGSELVRRQDRYRRAKLVNAVLRPFGLRFYDEWSGTNYVVANAKGASELVRNLGELWPVAERLAGRPLDPLDPQLLATLAEEAAHR